MILAINKLNAQNRLL